MTSSEKAAGRPDRVAVFPATPREDYGEAGAEIRLAVEEIDRNGYAVLQNRILPEQAMRMRQLASVLYDREVAELGGTDAMDRIGDGGVCRSPFLYEDVFLEPICDELVLQICKYYFGAVVLLNLQRIVLNTAGHEHAAAVWHRDHSYQVFTTSRPVSFTAIAMLDGSCPENGGPFILPGSHLFEKCPSDEFIRRHEQPVLTDPGSIVLLNSALFHRGGTNKTSSPRHAVVSIYTVPLIRQNVNYPRLLKGRFQSDPELAMLLGYNTVMPESDLEYRKTKLKRGLRIASDKSV